MEHFTGWDFAAAAQLPLSLVFGADQARHLQPWKFAPLPLGAVKPTGWLLGETKAMGNGMAGHMHDFYVFVNQSSWLNTPGRGGTEYSSLNEALPYWFNGLVPMAYQLDDDRLKGQVHQVADIVLGFQASDGWIGPEVGSGRNFWARAPFFMGLTQLVEADKSWEKRVVGGLRRFMALANQMLKNNSQGFANCAGGVDCTWGQARAHDLMITMQWMLEKYASEEDDKLLWENMDMLYAQSNFKWDLWYTAGKYPEVADPKVGANHPYIHGVNVGQGLKASSVIYRINGSSTMLQKAQDAVSWTFKHHGSSSGSILADEHERGLETFIGSELCTAVETAYSLSYMYQVHGDSQYADRAERTIFNAFPVMMTGDKWAHQYMAQPNQPFALNTTSATDGRVPPVYTTANSGVASTYGMEPLYPCCTVNHPQGYPKFTANSWVRVGEGGLGHVLLSPTAVEASVNGGLVKIKCDTDYPFATTFVYSITAEKSFDLYVRVPGWSDTRASSLVKDGDESPSSSSSSSIKPDPATGLVKVHITAGNTKVNYRIGLGLRVEPRAYDTISVLYGNLLYALDVGFSQTSSLPHAYGNPRGPGIPNLPFKELRDYYINSTKPWNVAIDPSTLTYHGMGDGSLKDPIFEHGAPPNHVSVQGCEIAWGLYMGVTPDLPPRSRKCISGRATYKLIPYGAAKVHMSDIPTVKF